MMQIASPDNAYTWYVIRVRIFIRHVAVSYPPINLRRDPADTR